MALTELCTAPLLRSLYCLTWCFSEVEWMGALECGVQKKIIFSGISSHLMASLNRDGLKTESSLRSAARSGENKLGRQRTVRTVRCNNGRRTKMVLWLPKGKVANVAVCVKCKKNKLRRTGIPTEEMRDQWWRRPINLSKPKNEMTES